MIHLSSLKQSCHVVQLQGVIPVIFHRNDPCWRNALQTLDSDPRQP